MRPLRRWMLAVTLPGLAAFLAFSIQARSSASVATSPQAGPPGTIFELTGAGFPPLSNNGTVSFDGVNLGSLGSDENGNVRGFFMVPDVRPGPARVRVAFGKVRADASFTVLPAGG